MLITAGVGFFWYEHIKHQPNFVHYPAFGIDIPTSFEVHGIDVSRYQGRIDWEDVKQMNVDDIKLSFTFIKATEGITVQDNAFDRNWEGAKKAGLIRGAYHYFYSTRDPVKQAQNFINHVKLEKGDLPPVLDFEITNGQPDSVLQATAKMWLHVIELYYKVKPIIYTNINFYRKHLGKAFSDYSLWIAHYYREKEPPLRRQWKFWQHSSAGHVNGIEKPVDFNVFAGDTTELKEMCLQR